MGQVRREKICFFFNFLLLPLTTTTTKNPLDAQRRNKKLTSPPPPLFGLSLSSSSSPPPPQLQDISPIDLVNIDAFARRVIALAEYRAALGTYLREKMHAVAPNLSALIGETVGARLISHAGSLVNLAKYPASTVQILGAEKALFRALKTKGNTPKYGLIFHSSFIGRAKAKNKGRISRYLANKASIASRIDCFSDVVTDAFGERMREQVEERLRFYDDGAATTKNSTAMGEAARRAGIGGNGESASEKKKSKKDKKDKKKDKKEEKEDKKEEKKEKKEKKRKSGDEDEGEKKKKKKKDK